MQTNKYTMPIINDYEEEKVVKIFPYLMRNAHGGILKDKGFVQDNTTSLVYIEQVSTPDTKTDSNGNIYFESRVDEVTETKIDWKVDETTIAQSLSEEKGFSLLTNYPAHGYEVYTIGKPYNQFDYHNGNQTVYFNSRTIKVEDSMSDYRSVAFDTEGLWNVELENIKLLESSFTNSRIIFTKFNLQHDLIDQNTSLKFQINNNALIGGIKGIGGIVNQDSSISEITDIEFKSKNKLTPFKMTPVSIQDRVVMYADWFDYDTTMPYIFAEKFKAGAGLEVVVTNDDDRHMIEDMLSVSAGFASSWDFAPVLTTGTEAGKIDPNFRMGHTGIKVSVIAGKDPIKVVDGIYENHIRKHPAFLTDPVRYQPAKEVLNALSRYLYSSYAIGKGQNSYNMAYLPWYLEPSLATPIESKKALQIANPDAGASGTVNTFIINDGVKFQVKSIYFSPGFSNDIPTPGTKDLVIPDKINLSNLKIVQTDRKLTLPEVGYSISPIDKLPLPGDINTNSSQDLSFMWYLPVSTQPGFEALMLDTLVPIATNPNGYDVQVSLPRTADGVLWDQATANAEVLKREAGTLTVPPVISKVSRVVGDSIETENNRNGTRIYINNVLVSEYQGIPIHTFIAARYNLDLAVDGTGWTLTNTGATGPRGGTLHTLTIFHNEFTPATVHVTGIPHSSYSFTGREVLFDKPKWKNFLTTYNITGGGIVDLDLEFIGDVRVIHELIFTHMWGETLTMFDAYGRNVASVPLFNQSDETVTTQRILII